MRLLDLFRGIINKKSNINLTQLKVTNDSFYNKSKSDTDKLTKQSIKSSDDFYKLHQEKLKNLNPYTVDSLNFKERKLNSIEKYFLKYLNNVDISKPIIAGYWTHEYNIDYSDLLNQYLGQELLEICDQQDISSLKVVQLKEIITTKNLSKTGKKADLINRITKNFTENELTQYLECEHPIYKLTTKGKQMVDSLKPSATKNTDLEDKCYHLLLAGEINLAYKNIASYEMSKPISRGIGLKWKEEFNNGLSKIDYINYTDHLNLVQTLPVSLDNFQNEINCIVILGNMLGISHVNILKMAMRLFDINIKKEQLYEAIITNYSYLSGKSDILSYLECGVEKYEILVSLDATICESCKKMNGKIFNVRDAEFGNTFPPFCSSCRCTTVAYYD